MLLAFDFCNLAPGLHRPLWATTGRPIPAPHKSGASCARAATRVIFGQLAELCQESRRSRNAAKVKKRIAKKRQLFDHVVTGGKQREWD